MLQNKMKSAARNVQLIYGVFKKHFGPQKEPIKREPSLKENEYIRIPGYLWNDFKQLAKAINQGTGENEIKAEEILCVIMEDFIEQARWKSKSSIKRFVEKKMSSKGGIG